MNRARALRWQFSLHEGPDLLTSITVRGPRRHFNHHVRRFPLGRFRNLRVNVVVCGSLKLRSNQETVERDSLRFDSGHSLGCWNLTRNIPIQRACHLQPIRDRKSTRLNSSHSQISYAVFCLKKKKKKKTSTDTTVTKTDRDEKNSTGH